MRVGCPVPFCFLRDRQATSHRRRPMTINSAHDILQETLAHLDAALETLNRLIEKSNQKGFDDPIRIKKRLLRLCDNPDVPQAKKIKRIARVMKIFSLLCNIDDLQNDLRCLRDNLDGLISNERVPASDVAFWRDDHRENMAAIFFLNREFDDA